MAIQKRQRGIAKADARAELLASVSRHPSNITNQKIHAADHAARASRGSNIVELHRKDRNHKID